MEFPRSCRKDIEYRCSDANGAAQHARAGTSKKYGGRTNALSYHKYKEDADAYAVYTNAGKRCRYYPYHFSTREN